MKYSSIILRYDELGLKKGNRSFFEKKLIENIKYSFQKNLNEPVDMAFHILRGRIILDLDILNEDILSSLSKVFGLSSFSPALTAQLDLEEIIEKALLVVEQELNTDKYKQREQIPFRVSTTRGNKKFEIPSMELDRQVSAVILNKFPQLKVNLTQPELDLGIDIRHQAYIYVSKIEGLRGLPVGTSHKMLSLLSGGIDSPVASFLMMRRGARVDFVNYHSPPYIGEASKCKIKSLCEILKRYQPFSRLFYINFTPLQTEIKKFCDESLRTILFRRAMLRIASEIAAQKHYSALITGEALGQVASQTISNLSTINAVSRFPILRPLVAYEKQDTIKLSRSIGTYETSILPYPDSCSVFAPSKPALASTHWACGEQEKRFDYELFIKNAVQEKELINLK